MFADMTTTPESTSPQLLRMLHKVQADIIVKEDLVAQLERGDLEYQFMRAKYEERLTVLQEDMILVERERDQALRRIGFDGTAKSGGESAPSSRPPSRPPSRPSSRMSSRPTSPSSRAKVSLHVIMCFVRV